MEPRSQDAFAPPTRHDRWWRSADGKVARPKRFELLTPRIRSLVLYPAELGALFAHRAGSLDQLKL